VTAAKQNSIASRETQDRAPISSRTVVFAHHVQHALAERQFVHCEPPCPSWRLPAPAERLRAPSLSRKERPQRQSIRFRKRRLQLSLFRRRRQGAPRSPAVFTQGRLAPVMPIKRRRNIGVRRCPLLDQGRVWAASRHLSVPPMPAPRRSSGGRVPHSCLGRADYRHSHTLQTA
jgi:hypothetical protein